jgi:hypothetical protein
MHGHTNVKKKDFMHIIIFKEDIPLWWRYTNARKEVVNHNNSFYVEKFYRNMFRLMYKEPSRG